jgi:hypothetical protein
MVDGRQIRCLAFSNVTQLLLDERRGSVERFGGEETRIRCKGFPVKVAIGWDVSLPKENAEQGCVKTTEKEKTSVLTILRTNSVSLNIWRPFKNLAR